MALGLKGLDAGFDILHSQDCISARAATRVRDDGRVIFKHHFANLGGLPPADSMNMVPMWEDLAAVAAPIKLVSGDRGTVNGAVIASASTVTISGIVNGDVAAAAGTIEVPGQVHGSVRATGGHLSLPGWVRASLRVRGAPLGPLLAPGLC